MKEKNRNQLLMILVLLILLLTGSSLYMLVMGILNNTLSNDFILIMLQLVVVLLLAMRVGKIQSSTVHKELNNSKINSETINDSKSIDSVTETTSKTTKQFDKKNFYRQGLPMFILIAVTAVFLLNQTGFSLFGVSSPEGRWVYEMEENTMVDGVWNLTDYWYMDFYDNGTLDIGWKNVNTAEDSEGSGSWYQEGNTIYVTIYYDYGATVYADFVIKSNQLIDADTLVPSGYFKD